MNGLHLGSKIGEQAAATCIPVARCGRTAQIKAVRCRNCVRTSRL